jgi:putative methyltransferase
MSLYLEAVAAITNQERIGGSLKSRIYTNKKTKHSPAQIYALVSESTKWSPILKEVVEKSQILGYEKKVIFKDQGEHNTFNDFADF